MCGINITISCTQEHIQKDIWILSSNQSSQKILTKENSPTVDIKEKLNLIPSKTKTKESNSIFVTEKKKRFPSSLKSVSEYLNDLCLFLYRVEDINLDFDKSTILNIDGRIFDMMESHYPIGQIFYLQECLKIMDSTLYKKKEGSLTYSIFMYNSIRHLIFT
jgi:hypothetical protein